MGKLSSRICAGILFAAALGAAGPAAAGIGPANVYRGATASEIAQLLAEEGVRGPIKKEPHGTPILLATSPEGLKFFVRFHNCEETPGAGGLTCYRIQYRAVFKDKESPPLRLMNAYHGNWVFGKVIAYDEERYFVEMPHNMSYGVTADNILHTYRLFLDVVGQFHKELNTYELSGGAGAEQANNLLTIRRDDAALDASLPGGAPAPELAERALGLPTAPVDTASDLQHIEIFDHTNE